MNQVLSDHQPVRLGVHSRIPLPNRSGWEPPWLTLAQPRSNPSLAQSEHKRSIFKMLPATNDHG